MSGMSGIGIFRNSMSYLECEVLARHRPLNTPAQHASWYLGLHLWVLST
jgi:hypothetical protein